MYKKRSCVELLDIKTVNTRARAAPLFKTVIPKCQKYKNSVLYNGAIKWNSLPVNIRNTETYDSFKLVQKKNYVNLNMPDFIYYGTNGVIRMKYIIWNFEFFLLL